MEIHYLNAFNDNYIWTLQNNSDLIIIDPGEAPQVLNYITVNKLNLNSIWLTHSHPDHIGGVTQILQQHKVPVYASFDLADRKTQDSEIITFFNDTKAQVLTTPGHTYDAACFYIFDQKQSHLFCGDTLFAAGCGRVFTGDYQAMFNSLNKLRQLDKNTLIYPGHEYTLKNLEFAKYLEPENQLILKRIAKDKQKIKKSGVTLPCYLSEELITNPFFRHDDEIMVKVVSNLLGVKVNPGLETFIKLRELRNEF